MQTDLKQFKKLLNNNVHLQITCELTCTGQVYSVVHEDGPAVQTDCTPGWAAR